MGGEELPPSCNFFSAIFYSVPPKRDFLSARITPKCLNSAVLTGELIRALVPTLCPTFWFAQAQPVPGDSGWRVIAAEAVTARERDGDRLCAQSVDRRDNEDMRGCTNGNRGVAHLVSQGELSIFMGVMV